MTQVFRSIISLPVGEAVEILTTEGAIVTGTRAEGSRIIGRSLKPPMKCKVATDGDPVMAIGWRPLDD